MIRAQSSPHLRKMSSVKRLTRQISKKILKLDSDSDHELQPEERLSLADDNEIRDNEFSWLVKIKSMGDIQHVNSPNSKKIARLLVVGPQGLRLLLPATHEESDTFLYKKMLEFSYNEKHEVFQFSWTPKKGSEEVIVLHTNKAKEIHLTISKFIKDLLMEKKIKNPEKVIEECTSTRPPELDIIKKGGRLTRSNAEQSTKEKEKELRQTQRRANRVVGNQDLSSDSEEELKESKDSLRTLPKKRRQSDQAGSTRKEKRSNGEKKGPRVSVVTPSKNRETKPNHEKENPPQFPTNLLD